MDRARNNAFFICRDHEDTGRPSTDITGTTLGTMGDLQSKVTQAFNDLPSDNLCIFADPTTENQCVYPTKPLWGYSSVMMSFEDMPFCSIR